MITSQNDCGRIFDPIVSNKIIPMVVFLNMEISDYKKVYCSKSNPGLNINIFSMDDFEKVLKNIVIPYDIVNYLLLRAEYIKEKFPHLLFWEMNEANISIARIDNEEGFIRHYNFLHDKSTLNIGDLLESFIFICYNMEGNIEYGGENYLQILLRLISFNREIAVLFVERWRKAVEDITINYIGFGMHIVIPQNSLGIIFITCISDD